MTPAIRLAKKMKIQHTVHQYTHDSRAESYGLEAAEKMGVEDSRVFKTLVVNLDDQCLAVAVIPVSMMLNMKLMAKASSAKKATMAQADDVERSTGYVLGGVSPIAQKKRLNTIIDHSAERFDTIFVSAGRRGLEIELSPENLKNLANGMFAELSAQELTISPSE